MTLKNEESKGIDKAEVSSQTRGLCDVDQLPYSMDVQSPPLARIRSTFSGEKRQG